MPKVGMEEIRKSQVLSAAKKCIIHKGISNLSMKAIAAEAGISTGIIYHYFKNKEDLLLQVLKDTFQSSHEQVLQTVEPLTDPAEKLLKHLGNINAVPKDNPDFYPLFLNYLGEANHHPEIQRVVIKFFNNLKAYMDDYLKDSELQSHHLSTIMYAIGLGLGIMWTIDNGQFEIEEMEVSLKNLLQDRIIEKS